MTIAQEIADQFREVSLKGEWVVFTNYKKELSDVSWKQATTSIGSLNTIAALTFHINYYVAGLVEVLEGGPLSIKDKFSFDCPLIESKEDWERLKKKMWKDAHRFAELLEALSDDRLREGFIKEEYGNYRRNFHAIIEHSYYHLGQIVLIKKLLAQGIGVD